MGWRMTIHHSATPEMQGKSDVVNTDSLTKANTQRCAGPVRDYTGKAHGRQRKSEVLRVPWTAQNQAAGGHPGDRTNRLNSIEYGIAPRHCKYANIRDLGRFYWVGFRPLPTT
jgi:hypothetical protein